MYLTIVWVTMYFLSPFTVWIEEPVIDTLESTSFPIEQVDFPTVTLCPKSSNTDRWGPVIKIFDNIKMT